MVWLVIWNAFIIFILRIISVALGTVRMILTGRGQRKIAPLLGFLESLIFVVSISQVMTNLDNIFYILGYSGGFAAGTWAGMLIENKLPFGHVGINIISLVHGSTIAKELRDANFGVTEIFGNGQSGALFQIRTVVSRREIKTVYQIVNRVDPQSFVTVDDIAVVKCGYMNIAR